MKLFKKKEKNTTNMKRGIESKVHVMLRWTIFKLIMTYSDSDYSLHSRDRWLSITQ